MAQAEKAQGTTGNSFSPGMQGHWWEGTKQINTNKRNTKGKGVGKALNRTVPSPLPQRLTDAVHRANIPKTVFTELSSICVVLYTAQKHFSLATKGVCEWALRLGISGQDWDWEEGLKGVLRNSPLRHTQNTHSMKTNDCTHAYRLEDLKTPFPSSGAGFRNRGYLSGDGSSKREVLQTEGQRSWWAEISKGEGQESEEVRPLGPIPPPTPASPHQSQSKEEKNISKGISSSQRNNSAVISFQEHKAPPTPTPKGKAGPRPSLCINGGWRGWQKKG